MSNKTINVRYFTRTGSTAKLAEKIATTAGCQAQTIDTPIKGKTDLLFLGASVYAGGIDKKVKEFIDTLDKASIGKVVIFSTSALVERAFPEIKKYLTEKGIAVAEENYYCRGQFTLLHKGRPNAKDLAEAELFTKNILSGD